MLANKDGSFRFGSEFASLEQVLHLAPDVTDRDCLYIGQLTEQDNPQKIQRDSILNILGSKRNQFFDNLRKTLLDEPEDIVLYIHGFRTTFDESIQSIFKLKSNFLKANLDAHFCLFSWPSSKSLSMTVNYYGDLKDTFYSAASINRWFKFLSELVKEVNLIDGKDRKLHLICHSMGNYALRYAFLHHAIELGLNNLQEIFDQVVIIAPDEDFDALNHDLKLRHLYKICRGLTFYYNKHDMALKGSKLIQLTKERLGSNVTEAALELSDKISIVDCSSLFNRLKAKSMDDFLVQHGYHLHNFNVICDIASTLNLQATEISKYRQASSKERMFKLTAGS